MRTLIFGLVLAAGFFVADVHAAVIGCHGGNTGGGTKLQQLVGVVGAIGGGNTGGGTKRVTTPASGGVVDGGGLRKVVPLHSSGGGSHVSGD
ncbi:MAG TPA: hypothetical protein DCE42_12850 [Myxococcales bacterium]|nr:hypothetical protein [Deltaproteobacteria bacterium]MBK07362.1 hypothetical protein [Deltaproteobacteria bacterium]MBU53513.1 hypothetical protein [Deltaproteobacteria bacterium]HAA55643.1 hypothetical protein [Myxococcales bacterium]|tara:strand:- start:6149 stop:6424 length:276 start_codon:yes stop_codon:yes gene_type:complete